MSDNTQVIFDALFGPTESEADVERKRESLARFCAARDELEPHFPHEILDPFEREVTWGIVAAGLELANAHVRGGTEGLSKQIEATVIDERFGPFLEAIHRMLEWVGSVVDGSGGEHLLRTVQEAVASADPPLRLFRAVAGLLAVGIREQLPADEIAGELAPVFREQTSIPPSTPGSVHEVTDAQIGPGEPLVYGEDSVGYQIADYGFREIQQSSRDPDLVYVLDEFMTLLECSLTTGSSRVIAQPFAPLTRERREKLAARGRKVNPDYPGEHPFYFDDDAGLLYIASHTRLFEVWEVRSGRRIHQEALPDQGYVIHPVRPGVVRIAVRGSGLVEFDGTHLRPLEGLIPRDMEFVAAPPLRWGDFRVYTITSGLLFVADDGSASGVLEIPRARDDRLASACLLNDQIVVTTWNRYLHVYRGRGMPWNGWTSETRRLASYVCVAPDEPWGVVFDRHTDSTAMTGAWSYEIVDDVRALDEGLARTHVVPDPGLRQIVAQPLHEQRLLIWHETERSAAMEFGTRESIRGTMRAQTLPPTYYQTIVSSDGSLTAFHNWDSPASLAVTDARGEVIARTEFPWIHTLLSLDPHQERLVLRGQSTTEDEQTADLSDARPQLSIWSWHWPSDSWTSAPAAFHGWDTRRSDGRDHVSLYLNEERDLKFSGVAGVGTLVMEERPEEELVIVNDAVRRVDELSADMQFHPLRPLLHGRTVNEINMEVGTEGDRAWISEPGGLINGYSLHDGVRLWRITLPGAQRADRAVRLRLNRIEGMRSMLTLRTHDGRIFMIDAGTGAVALELVLEGDRPSEGFLPVLTREALLLPVANEIWAWKLPGELL